MHNVCVQVWLAEWTGCAVAVKELMGFGSAAGDDRLWEEMQNEVHMLGTYNHPNVVRFVGVCTDPPMIVMQYYPHGSMFDLLQVCTRMYAEVHTQGCKLCCFVWWWWWCGRGL
jgi:serine/threonine protein kinase